MKKFTKIALGCTIVFAAVGVGLSAAGIAMGAASTGKEALSKIWDDALESGNIRWSVITKEDTDWADLKDGDWEHSEVPMMDHGRNIYEFGRLSEVDVELSSDELYFQSYEGNGIQVETDDQNDKVRVKQDGESLKIKSLGKLSGSEIIVYYPADMHFHEMDIEVDAGTIHLESEISVDELEIQVGAGELIANALVYAEDMNLQLGAGMMDISELETVSLEAECGVGEMNLGLTGEEREYSYKVECGLGSVSIGGKTYSGIAESQKIRNDGSWKEMEIECGLGEVVINFGK